MASTCFFYKAPQPKPAPYWKCIMFGDCFPKSPIDKVVFKARSLFKSCRKLWSSSFWSAHSWTRSKATVHNESGNLLQFSIWFLKAWGLFIIWLGTAHCWHSVHSAGTPPFCQRCGVGGGGLLQVPPQFHLMPDMSRPVHSILCNDPLVTITVTMGLGL